MGFEIWASDSGNLIHAERSLREALGWVRAYWQVEGDRAFEVLSVGDAADRRVLSGEELREAVARLPVPC
jgi:hypothetical protein